MQLIAPRRNLTAISPFVLQAIQQPQHRGSLFDAAIQLKHHFRGPAHLQSPPQFSAQVTAGCLQTFHHLGLVVGITKDADENLAVLQVS